MTVTVAITETNITATASETSVAVSVASAPISVSVASLDPNSHAAVTLDVNADTLLSLSTQALGLDTQTANRIFSGPSSGAAAVPTFRALVAGDIPALSYEPIDATIVRTGQANWIDLTDGGATTLHSHAGGGGTWGSITGTLSAQTDLQTALDAKQDDLTFPIAASLGGTGINNASATLTLPNLAITLGGGGAAQTYTLPAAGGTFALLNAANVFTTQQMVDGTSDQIQLRVQAHSTQTANLQTWENSSGTVLLYVTPNGGLISSFTQSDGSVDYFHNNLSLTYTPTVGGNKDFTGFQSSATKSGSQNDTGKLIGGKFASNVIGSGSMTTIWGGYFQTLKIGTGAVSSLVGGYFQTGNLHATGVITNNYGLYVTTPTATGAITNEYGLYIASQNTASTLNYAIYTNAGLVHFGDTVDLASGKNLTLLAGNITTDTTTGSKIGTATTQKLGFWNATPIIQPAGATQAAPAAYVTGAFGLDSSANMQALYDLVVAMRTALVNSGIMKGAA